jgi:hypothetical protein
MAFSEILDGSMHEALLAKARRRIAKLESRLLAIATAKPMEGEPLWYFLDRVQAIASQSDAGAKHD